MAIQVIRSTPSFGGQLGASLGSGLGEGLSMLAQNKMNEITMQKRAKAWQSIGLPENEANFLVQQPEWIQKEFIGRLEGFGSGGGQATQAGEPVVPGAMGQQPAPSLKIGMSKEDKKMAHENQKLINKEVFPYIKDVQTKAKSAKENDIRLNRMQKLVDSGKLNNPQFASLIKTVDKGIGGIFGHVGVDLKSLLSTESQEFEKLSSDFVKNAKDVFGGRLTDTDLKTFMATVPTLSQTNEGKSAVIRNLKLMNQAAEIKNKAARELLKKYNNKPPLDFESQVDDYVKPQLDAIAAEFEKGSTKKAAKTSAFLGDVAGVLPQVTLGVS